jgi:hypothetical protein
MKFQTRVLGVMPRADRTTSSEIERAVQKESSSVELTGSLAMRRKEGEVSEGLTSYTVSLNPGFTLEHDGWRGG